MAVLRNVRHELFVVAWITGMPASQAYVKAGYKPNPANARRLTRRDYIIARRAELQRVTAVGVETTQASLVAKTHAIYDAAMLNEAPVLDRYGKPTGETRQQLTAASSVVKLEAQLTGHLIERKDVLVRSLDDMSMEELRAELEKTRALIIDH